MLDYCIALRQRRTSEQLRVIQACGSPGCVFAPMLGLWIATATVLAGCRSSPELPPSDSTAPLQNADIVDLEKTGLVSPGLLRIPKGAFTARQEGAPADLADTLRLALASYKTEYGVSETAD